mgnify:CR=1 FL=1
MFLHPVWKVLVLMVSLKQFVIDETYKEFQEYLENQIKLLHRSMESARSPEDFYRLQGQVLSLRKLQNMKEDVLKRDK